MMAAAEETLKTPMSGSTITTSLMRPALLTRPTVMTMELAAVQLLNAKIACRTVDAGLKTMLKSMESNNSEK